MKPELLACLAMALIVGGCTTTIGDTSAVPSEAVARTPAPTSTSTSTTATATTVAAPGGHGTLQKQVSSITGTIGDDRVRLTYHEHLDNVTGTIGDDRVRLTYHEHLDNVTGTIGDDRVRIDSQLATGPVTVSGPPSAAAVAAVFTLFLQE